MPVDAAEGLVRVNRLAELTVKGIKRKGDQVLLVSVGR